MAGFNHNTFYALKKEHYGQGYCQLFYARYDENLKIFAHVLAPGTGQRPYPAEGMPWKWGESYCCGNVVFCCAFDPDFYTPLPKNKKP